MEMYNAEMRGSRRRSAGGNNHQVVAKARRGSGRSGQIDTNGSGLTCTEQQFFRRHTAHEFMRIGTVMLNVREEPRFRTVKASCLVLLPRDRLSKSGGADTSTVSAWNRLAKNLWYCLPLESSPRRQHGMETSQDPDFQRTPGIPGPSLPCASGDSQSTVPVQWLETIRWFLHRRRETPEAWLVDLPPVGPVCETTPRDLGGHHF
jgi:hypothetical protein